MPTLPQENTHAQALNTSSPYQYRPFSPAQLPPSSPLHDRLRHQPCCSTPGVMPFCSNTAVFPSLTILCVAPKTTGTAPAEVIRPPKCQLLASLGSPQGATWREATPQTVPWPESILLAPPIPPSLVLCTEILFTAISLSSILLNNRLANSSDPVVNRP